MRRVLSILWYSLSFDQRLIILAKVHKDLHMIGLWIIDN